jgi:hypothetical protein
MADVSFTPEQLQSGFAAVEGQTVERCARLVESRANAVASDFGKEGADGVLTFRSIEMEELHGELIELADAVRGIRRVYHSPKVVA